MRITLLHLLLRRRFEMNWLLLGAIVKVARAVLKDALLWLLDALAGLHHAPFVLKLERHRLVLFDIDGRSDDFTLVLGRHDC